jgi:uncharacterized DUF497 family protein
VRIEGILWLEEIVEKLWQKHRVTPEEVEQLLEGRPRFYYAEQGRREGEDVYMALGRTEAGRYLAVLFVHKLSNDALILSARDMAPKERKRYDRK